MGDFCYFVPNLRNWSLSAKFPGWDWCCEETLRCLGHKVQVNRVFTPEALLHWVAALDFRPKRHSGNDVFREWDRHSIELMRSSKKVVVPQREVWPQRPKYFAAAVAVHCRGGVDKSEGVGFPWEEHFHL